MSQKNLAFHVEGNTRKELAENIRKALVDAEINIGHKSADAEEAPAKPAKKAAKEEAASKKDKKAKKVEATLEQVKEALTALKDSSAGAKAVKKIYAKFGVKKADDFEEEQLADALKAAQAAMPEDEEEEEEDSEDEEDEDADEDGEDEDDE